MSDAIRKPRIVFLDYMRVFAFVSVLIGHKFFDFLTLIASAPDQHISIRLFAEAMIPLCQGGAAGVVVFFLTSGYIITHVLQNEAPGDFLLKRIFRIYPLYIFAVAMELSFSAASGTAIPDAITIIQRMLLIGDFFNTPYGLAGVEWTLRIEVAFYLLMFLIKASGLMKNQWALPVLYLAIAAALFAAPVFPNGMGWSNGYFNMYSMFLLCGSCIYLAQKSLANRSVSGIAIFLMCFMFLALTAKIQPNWKESNYAMLAVGIFLLFFFCRELLSENKVIGLLSELTYSVYLFHNWLWEYIYSAVSIITVRPSVALPLTTLALLIFCYATYKTVETYGVRAGSVLLRRIKTRHQPALRT